MMARWLHALQQFQFSIIHRPGKDHGNADGLSRAPSSPCRQCTRPDCPPVVLLPNIVDQPFDSESTGSSEDADLIPIHTGEDWVAQLDDDLSQPTAISGDSFWISNIQREDPVCITLHSWILSGDFPPWVEVKGLNPELRLLWHHHNDNGIIWRKRSSQCSLVPKPGREQLFLSYHASLFGGHLVRNRTLARLAPRFYWTGMSVRPLRQEEISSGPPSPIVKHSDRSLLGSYHNRILDVCDPTQDGYRYILVIADYFSKWTEAFPMKNKCADTVTDLLVDNIILRFGMPLVIHSDQVESLKMDLGCTKTQTAPYHPELNALTGHAS